MSSGNNSWDSNDRWQDNYDAEATRGLELPVLPTIPSGSIDLGSIAPVFGVAGYDDDSADYLDYNKAGRPFMEQLSGTCGSAYFTGIIGGGTLGAAQGFVRSPSTKFKIRMNALMNGAALRGSKAGNALGCLGKRIVAALARYRMQFVLMVVCALSSSDHVQGV